MDAETRRFAQAMIWLDRVVQGSVGIIEGCRAFVSHARSSGIEEDDDFLTLVAVASETDDLPVGPIRASWAGDALKEKDREIAEAEGFYKDCVLRSANALLKKYAP